jgi:hypothetical protein
LQDIVVVLGDAEDPMPWLRDIPATINERKITKNNESFAVEIETKRLTT